MGGRTLLSLMLMYELVLAATLRAVRCQADLSVLYSPTDSMNVGAKHVPFWMLLRVRKRQRHAP